MMPFLVRRFIFCLLGASLVFGVATGWAVPATPAAETPEAILTKLCTSNGISRSSIGTITLKESTQINAYTDGQNIVVYSRLWDLLETNDRRAFVIGHELGHIQSSHVLKGGLFNTGLNVLIKGVAQASGSMVGTLATQGAAKLASLKYTRSQEYQADDLGFRLFRKAGYSPKASTEAFEIMQKAGGGGSAVEFLQSHPLDKKRIDTLAKRYQLMPVSPPSGK